MNERADHVHISITMSDHHTFWSGGSAAGVVDRQQITFLNFRPRKFYRSIVEQGFIIEPAVSGRTPFECNEGSDVMQLRTNFVNCLYIVGMSAYHLRAAVIDQVNKVVGR